jgi:2-amino-4-hydroxy-6-hydroxymethyldihydropteridine diphosphokinase
LTVYIALGSNVGDRAAHLRAALEAMGHAGVRVRRVSAFSETAPVGTTGRRAFLNAVVEAETTLLPRVLLRRLLGIERAQRRWRLWPRRRKTPRPLDVDLIFYGRARLRMPELMVPHPRFAERPFVLEGLAELVPAGHAPGSAATLRQTVRRAGSVLA